MEHDLELVLVDSGSSLSTNQELRRQDKKIEIGDGLSLSPPPIRAAGAIGSLDVVGFVLSVPLGIASHLAAIKLHEWLEHRSIRRVRVNGVELEVSGKTAEVVEAMAQLLERRAEDPQRSDPEPPQESDPQ